MSAEKAKSFASECSERVRKECVETSMEIMKARICPAIEALLALDVLPQTKDVCVSIAARMCLHRVNQWIKSHIVTDIFSKLFESGTLRFVRDENKSQKVKTAFALPEDGLGVPHDDSTLSAAHILTRIQVNEMYFCLN